MVVGVDGLGPALGPEYLDRAVGDDLVGIGVGRCAGTRLVNVDRELVVKLAVDYLLRRSGDRSRPSPREQAQLHVRLGGRLLHHSQGADEASWEWLAGDRKVEDSALR